MEKENQQEIIIGNSLSNILLSLDLSTTVMGYCVFNIKTEEIIEINYYSFKEKELIDRAKELKEKLDLLIEKHKVTEVGLEESMKSFRAASTNADAMIKTSRLNFLCQYLIKYIYKKPLTEVNVMTARSACFPGFAVIARAQKGVKQKLIAFQMAIKELGESAFPKKIMKSGPRKGDVVFIDEAMDMSDAWVIGKAILNIRKRPLKVTKKKKNNK